LVFTVKPALCALINGLITLLGTTRRKRIPTKVNNPTFTPAAKALIHSMTGTKVNKMASAIKITAIIIIGAISTISIFIPPILFYIIFREQRYAFLLLL